MTFNSLFPYRKEIQHTLKGLSRSEKREILPHLAEFSQMQIQELLELSNSKGISAAILKDLGVDFQEEAPSDEEVIEIEEYMKKVEGIFNARLNNIKISSIKYLKGDGGIECTSTIPQRLSATELEDVSEEKGVQVLGDNSIVPKGEICMKVSFDIPGTVKESVIIEFKSLTDDPILYKHDVIILRNLLIGKNIGGVIEEKSKKLKEKYSDGMTGLYNSTYFDEILRRNNHNYSGIFIDIASFKRVNDENGQNFGDEAIKEVAKFLEKSVRPNDKVVRIGGDEFFILFHNGENSQGVNEENIESLIARMKEKSSDLELFNPDHGRTVPIELKYGYAVSHTNQSKNSGELLRIANDMLNEEKDPEGKAYRVLSMFKELKTEAIIPTIKYLISNEIFTDKFFPALFRTEDGGNKFFEIFHGIIYDNVSRLGRLNINLEDLANMREYLEYIQLFRTKGDDELRKFFSN